MTTNRVLGEAPKIKALHEKLSRLDGVNKYDQPNEPEGWTIALAFSDLEGSCMKFTQTLLPRLVQEELSDEKMKNLLLEIGEEFRHILYHLKDPQFYRYLWDDERLR